MSPANPIERSFRVEQSRDVRSLKRRTGSYFGASLLALWLAAWTVGCIVIAEGAVKQPTIQHLLLAIFAWAVWARDATMLVRLCFGAEELLIGPEGLVHRTSALWTLAERHIPPNEIEGIAAFSAASDSEAGHVERGLEIATRGEPLRLGHNLTNAERLWLADLLHDCFPGLARNPPAPVPNEPAILHAEATPPEPPLDCLIKLKVARDELVFTRRGSFSLATFAAAGFFCLFWNGFVGAFAFRPCDPPLWSLYLALIPLVTIGFFIFVVWLLITIAPFLEATWAVGRAEIVARSLAFGLGMTRRIATDDVRSLELRKDLPSGVEEEARHIPQEELPYRLVFTGRDGRDLLTIRGLTLGEARWMGGHMIGVLKGTLAKAAKRPQREGITPPAADDPEFGLE